jgi:hypothetical protein
MACFTCATIWKSFASTFVSSRSLAEVRIYFRRFDWALAVAVIAMRCESIVASPPRLEVRQLTNGPQHHFFGYVRG